MEDIDLTKGLIIAHIVVSLLVICTYGRIAMLKKRKTFQKYKNVILWSVSALVISLILLDLFAKLDGLPERILMQ